MAFNRKELKVEPTTKKNQNPYSKDVIVDPMGQWKYPGEITKIPSNQITMEGVPYPVLGVDNLGNEQMMYPGLDYTFPGQSVTEYPQMDEEEMRYGGLKKKRRKTTNPAVGINDLMLRNPFYHTRKGASFVPYKEKGGSTGGWLDKYQTGKEVPPKKYDTSKMWDPSKQYMGPPRSEQEAKQMTADGRLKPEHHTSDEWYKISDNRGEDLFEIIDPTGVSSWDDVKRSYEKTGMSPSTYAEIFGALPMVGKLGKLEKGMKLGTDFFKEYKTSKLYRTANAAGTAENAIDYIRQYGGASATDSLNVYNNAIQLKGFYDKLSPYYKKPKVGEMSNYHTEKIKSGEIQKKTLGHEDVTEANKNIIRANTDPNIQYFSDLVTAMIDPNAPLMRYDRRIKPQGVIDYRPKSPFHDVLMNKGLTDEDAYSAESFFSTSSGPVEDSFNKEKIEELSKQTKISTPVLQALYKNQEKISDSLPGFITTIPYYDPTEVKPWYLRTPQEKIDFAKKHPAKPIKKSPAIKPSVINSSVVSDTQKIIQPKEEEVKQEIKKIVATAPIPKKPTGPTKYQTVSKTGQRYYFVDNQPVDSEDKYNAAKATEIDRETGVPVEKALVTKKMGGWLDNYDKQ